MQKYMNVTSANTSVLKTVLLRDTLDDTIQNRVQSSKKIESVLENPTKRLLIVLKETVKRVQMRIAYKWSTTNYYVLSANIFHIPKGH